MNNKIQSGIGVILYAEDKPIAGQENATLNRKMSAINITNQIKADWAESLAGLKTWDVYCNGVYVKTAKDFKKLEDAFMENKEIKVQIHIGNVKYQGQALITDFPLTAVFNNSFKYSLSLLGTGELKKVYE